MAICPVQLVNRKRRISLLCLAMVTSMVPLSTQAAKPEILDKAAVEQLFQNKLISYQGMISENKIEELQQAVREFTHDETIVLFEFTLNLPDQAPLPAQRAYFNRDPFIQLLKNAESLDKDSFEISYQLDDFKPQYGGGSAIIRDSGTARGKMIEPFSGDEYKFNVSQECRNTISADAKTTFKVDSIYCRMNIEYEPAQKTIISVDGSPVKELEKPPIADIISDIENKKKSAE